MKRLTLLLTVATTVLVFAFPTTSYATSGACSWHGGVNCAAGADIDGSVICSDGWRDSSVSYSSMAECQQPTYCLAPIASGCTTENDYASMEEEQIKNGTSMYAPEMAQGDLAACRSQINTYQAGLSAYQNCLSAASATTTAPSASATTCSANSSYDPTIGTCVPDYQKICTSQFGSLAIPVSDKPGYCQCLSGNHWNASKTSCEPTASCIGGTVNDQNACTCGDGLVLSGNSCISYTAYCQRDHGTNAVGSAGPNGSTLCSCSQGFQWDNAKVFCVNAESNTPPTTLPSTQDNTPATSNTVVNADLVNRLNGTILLQVEDAGKAWYVRPDDGRRYYLADGTAAYQMMRSFGLGITDSDLATIPAAADSASMKSSASVCQSNSLAKKLAGKILLQVQQHGEAWYVYPGKCRRIYLKDGATAYNVMRYLSLGITNADIAQIAAGAIEP